MEKIYDLTIIGAGPAGLTAAIYAVRKKIHTLLLSKDLGGQASMSGNIENYLGFSLISGAELVLKFRSHLEEFKEDFDLMEGVEVVGLIKQDDNFVTTLADGRNFLSRSVIIASGRIPRLLNIPGEKEFLGKGVSTCATCDGPFAKGKTVAIIGGGNSALDAAIVVEKFAEKIYLVDINPELGGDLVLRNKVISSKKITVIHAAQSKRILANSFVVGLEYEDKISGEIKKIDVGMVFVEIGYIPSTSFDRLTEKDQWGQIKVDGDLQTSISGLFAAGDVNNLWGEQIIIAAGEGAKAALRASNFLSKKE